MTSEPDLSCPKCGNIMELLTADEGGSLLRVCPVCATLAWNAPDGRVETREPQEVTGEESGSFSRTRHLCQPRKSSKLRRRKM